MERRRVARKLVQLHTLFAELDEDGSGCIDRDEVSILGRRLFGQPLTLAQLDTAMLAMDPNGDGEITIEEFSGWYLSAGAKSFRHTLKQAEKDAQTTNLRTLFNQADEDGSGEIDTLETEEMISSLFGTALSVREQKRALKSMDPSGDGQISFEGPLHNHCH